MITIKNSHIAVEILDPSVDGDMMGSRYCAGCYIRQIYDMRGRALLSGPHFPKQNPPPFDGQGMPEVFETPLGGAGAAIGGEVCVIGVGLVKKTSDIEPFHPRNNPQVAEPCLWKIERGDDFVAMATEQKFGNKSLKLSRKVRIVDNCVESISVVNNTGVEDIDIRWFPHPFFPRNNDNRCGKINHSTQKLEVPPDSAGYETDDADTGMVKMKSEYPWEKGLFQLLKAPPTKLTFNIPHSIIGQVSLFTDYDVIRCPIWANARTFSFEPFMQRVVKPLCEVTWKTALIVN